MKLIECYIENFGKLSDLKLSFSEGLNSIKKDNGYGKTTLSVFIKAMLFGLDDTKRQKLESNDRKHYMPWQGGRCGGSLTLDINGKIYRIERTFMPKASGDTFKLYDQKSGNESLDYTENIGEELFKIDADGFERTVFLSEANLAGKNENKTVSAKLSDLTGCDWDLSTMDEAIDLLEKQRKVYLKKGGLGEISDIKNKLSAVDREIFDLERKKHEYSSEKNELDRTFDAILTLKKKREENNQKIKNANEKKIKRAFLAQYKQMKESLDKDREKERSLEAFFKNSFPSQEEIEEIKLSLNEAKRIKENGVYEESEELKNLRSFFACDISVSDYEKAKGLPERIEGKKKEAELLTNQLNESKEKNAKAYQNSSKIKWGLLLVLGILAIVGAAILGLLLTPLLFSLSAIGIILIILSLKAKSSKEKSGELIQAKRELEARISAINLEIKSLESDACQFISFFKLPAAESITAAIQEIFRKRDLYFALENAQMVIFQKRAHNIEKADQTIKKCQSFLSLFPTVSDKPFEEISKNVMELETLKKTIEAKLRSMEEYAREHGINPDDIYSESNADVPDSTTDESLEIEEQILTLEREKTIRERRLFELSEEIDRIDELICEREQLSDKVLKLEKKVDIILKAKSFLGEAKNNLTAKYLFKTKTAFDKYISIIGAEEAESFSMNTSFEIMKNEKGTLRDAASYSRGTKDLFALAARLALIDSLYEAEAPFIILDDPFAYFDDARLKNALFVIEKLAKERQIIYLTCSESRKI